MKIDTHQHFWNYNPIRDSWIDNTMEVIKRDFLPHDLEGILKKNNIDGCISVQASQSEDETKFLLDIASKNNFVKGVVGWVDLRSEDVDEKLAFFSENKKLVGIRHILQGEDESFMLKKDFQNGISKLNKFNLSYDVLIFPKHLKSSIKLVSNFPNQTFIVNHIAKPNIKDGEIDLWRKDIEELAKFNNVFCKISGMVTQADWNNWSIYDFTKYLDVIFKSFGIDRIMYGSDWPVCLVAGEYKEQLKIVTTYISKLKTESQEKILGLNAVKAYQL